MEVLTGGEGRAEYKWKCPSQALTFLEGTATSIADPRDRPGYRLRPKVSAAVWVWGVTGKAPDAEAGPGRHLSKHAASFRVYSEERSS